MKKFWNWILGIVVILVVLFALGVGSRLLLGNVFPARTVGFDELRMPMMGGRGIIGMPHIGMSSTGLGWLLPLALIGLVIYGAYRLGKRNNQVVTTPPAAPAVVRTCARCGAPVQEGWNHCASCGRKL